VKVEKGKRSHDASKVKVYGDGVKPSGVLASLPVSFTVDTSQAGDAEIEIIIEVTTDKRLIYLNLCKLGRPLVE